MQRLLESMPSLQVVAYAVDPEGFWSQPGVAGTDLVLVDLGGEADVPNWLEPITRNLPQATVLVCSTKLEPELLIRCMQLGVREVLPAPLERPKLEAALQRVKAVKKRFPQEQRQGRVVVVTGHKGGAGATAVAVNLAVAMAQKRPGQVALVDLGRPFPDVGNFLNLAPVHTLVDLVQNISRLDPTFITGAMQYHDSNISILHGPQDLKDNESIEPEALRQIFDIMRTMYEWVVVDLGHWLDHLYASTIQEADQVMLLTQITVPDLQNLKKLRALFRDWSLDPEKIKVVVNRYNKGNGLVLGDLQRVQQEPPYFTLPSDYSALMESINQGGPLVSVAPKSKLCGSFQQLARQVMQLPEEQEEGSAQKPWRKKILFFF